LQLIKSSAIIKLSVVLVLWFIYLSRLIT